VKYTILFSKSVKKFLSKMDKPFRENCYKCIEIISENPFENNLDIKPLTNIPNSFRLRLGKFRILYEIDRNQILIFFFKADSRGDVYKK